MPSAAEVAWLIPLLPLVGASLVGLGLISFNRTLNRLRTPVAALLISCVGGSAALSYGVLLEQLNGAAPYEQLFTWASAGTFNLQMGFCVDPLGAVMLALVTTIALLVMVYSHGYMAHDKGYVRFFTYLALFSSSMLGLIISPNLLEIYVFWELVGMCSYLLVGFWYDRDGAAHAAQKAFVVNRVGDFGLLLGILGLLGHRQLRFPGNRRWLAERPGRRNGGAMGRAAALPAGVHGSDGQVGSVPPPRLAARCHGGPNADFSADSRRNDGGRRGVPGRPP